MIATLNKSGAAAVVAAALVIALGASAISAEERSGLVVHEWGTFSSFSGSNGKLLHFHPENTDLPRFVHRNIVLTKESISGTVSLETPVLYFYSDKPITANVRADFPLGLMTEWFPKAERSKTGSGLIWPEVRVRPGDKLSLPRVGSDNHYYAARETDAAPLEVPANKEGTVFEQEGFLFYRGVGTKQNTPLVVTALGHDSFSIRATENDAVTAAILLEVKGAAIRFRRISSAGCRTGNVSLPAEWSDVAALKSKLVELLTQAGLFEKEAKAMVKTWEKAWLGDDGTRVLYLLPSSWTDRTLPLHINPKPDTIVRVMVGRHDVLTPERERELDSIVQELKRLPKSEQAAAAVPLTKLGRFAGPARMQAEARVAARQ